MIINGDRTNNRVVDFNLQNFSASHVVPYVTDADSDMEQRERIPVTNGRFTLSVDAESMITLMGTAGTEEIVPSETETSTVQDVSETEMTETEINETESVSSETESEEEQLTVMESESDER